MLATHQTKQHDLTVKDNHMDIVAFLTEWFNAGFSIGISEVFQFILSLIWALLGF